MTLLAPLALVGLVALGLPVAAHMLGRETPKPIRFAAMRFLSPTEPSVTPRKRLQDLPLLIVRLLLLAALIGALADASPCHRPIPSRWTHLPPRDPRRSHRRS